MTDVSLWRQWSSPMQAIMMSPFLACMFPAPMMAESSSETAHLCVQAAEDASRINSVPLSVMVAISQTETGRGQGGIVQPWPWTVNIDGEGHWFDNKDSAITFAAAQFESGSRSFDVGCFQINYRWHGENFVSIEQMFDPLANATYAAGFLASLHDETGDWSLAAGAYHSRTPEHAVSYRARFDQFRAAAVAAGVDTGASPELATVNDLNGSGLPRRNSFVLLQSGGIPRGLGSLVPLAAGG